MQEIANLNQVMNSPVVAPTDALSTTIIEALADDLDTPTVVEAINHWVEESLNGKAGGDHEKISKLLENLLGFSAK
jgi:cysteinyl-tRNA synthetase